MASRLPPIPPANRSQAGPGARPTATDADPNHPDRSSNPNQKGQSANTRINRTPQMSVQDR